MITVNISDIESQPRRSRAVSVGQHILHEMRERGLGRGAKVSLYESDLDDAQWSEMVAYLDRRGVRVEYDDESNCTVARMLAD